MIATQAPTGCATVHWAMSGLRMPPRRRRRHPSSDRCHGNCPTHHPMPQSLPNLCPAGIAAQAAEPPVPGSSALCTDPACRRCTPDGSRCAECHGPDMAPTGPLQGLNASGACVRCNVAGEHADRCVRCDGDRPTVCLECVPYHHKFGSSGERGGGGGGARFCGTKDGVSRELSRTLRWLAPHLCLQTCCFQGTMPHQRGSARDVQTPNAATAPASPARAQAATGVGVRWTVSAALAVSLAGTQWGWGLSNSLEQCYFSAPFTCRVSCLLAFGCRSRPKVRAV